MSREMRDIEKAFDKMTKDEKKKTKREKKRKNKDVWTVLAILSSVMILALAIAWLKSGETVVKSIVSGTEEENRRIFETTRNILFGAGFLSILAVIVYIVKSIKYRKRKEPAAEMAFIDYNRLDAAKARVEKARMEQKSGKGSRGSYELYDDNTPTKKRPEGMSEAEYRAMRQKEYEKYMSMDFDEDGIDENRMSRVEDDYEDYDTIGRFEAIKDYIGEHKLAFGIAVGGALLGLIAIVVLIVAF